MTFKLRLKLSTSDGRHEEIAVYDVGGLIYDKEDIAVDDGKERRIMGDGDELILSIPAEETDNIHTRIDHLSDQLDKADRQFANAAAFEAAAKETIRQHSDAILATTARVDGLIRTDADIRRVVASLSKDLHENFAEMSEYYATLAQRIMRLEEQAEGSRKLHETAMLAFTALADEVKDTIKVFSDEAAETFDDLVRRVAMLELRSLSTKPEETDETPFGFADPWRKRPPLNKTVLIKRPGYSPGEEFIGWFTIADDEYVHVAVPVPSEGRIIRIISRVGVKLYWRPLYPDDWESVYERSDFNAPEER